MSLDDAKRYFAKNLDMFSNPNLHPEKYNYYMGMVALTEALHYMQGENRKLKTQVAALQKKVGKIKREG